MLQELTFRAMNSQMQVLLATDKSIRQLETPIVEGFELAEQRFSRFRSSSECSYLNARSGQMSLVSESMMEVLELASHYKEQTAGIFDICVGHALERAGYGESFEKINGNVVEHVPQLPLSGTGLALQVDPWMKSIRIPSHCQLDFGGIVKSWTALQVAHQLQRDWQVDRGLLNAGGDVVVWGGASENEPWCIGIANPFDADTTKEASLQLITGAVATSSILRRRWRTRKGEQHHLIDPRTMRPCTSSVVQCTVAGTDLIACEVWAKTMCILGIEAGASLFQRKTHGMEAIAYTAAGEVFHVRPHPHSKELTWTGLEGAKEL